MDLLTRTYPSSQQKREELVTLLQNVNILHEQALAEALLVTPREAFVPAFYRDGNQHDLVKASDPTYLDEIYQNQPLITKIDERGIPLCSSSMPGVMVRMIEALQITKKHRVLEIGTGTGYNAALLATLAARCTTIDIDPCLIKDLQIIVQHFGLERLYPYTQNGLAGYPDHSPYDRILVTASTPTIPAAWIGQLAPGGLLVCDFAGSMEHAFLILEKDEQGCISGHIRSEQLWFMPLYGASIPNLLQGPLPMSPATYTLEEDCDLLADTLQNNRSFRWFVQTAMPGIKLQHICYDQKPLWYLIPRDENNTYITFIQDEDQHWHVTLHTPTDIEDSDVLIRLLSIYEQWKNQGRPQVEAYTLAISAGKPVFKLHDQKFPLLSL